MIAIFSILAFEGDERITHSVGDYDYYLEKQQRRAAPPAPKPAPASLPKSTLVPTAKPRKLSYKEMREHEGMEAQVHAADDEIARLERLFAAPDFYRTHATQTDQLVADLAAAKESLARLYARWEELEAIKTAGEK